MSPEQDERVVQIPLSSAAMMWPALLAAVAVIRVYLPKWDADSTEETDVQHTHGSIRRPTPEAARTAMESVDGDMRVITTWFRSPGAFQRAVMVRVNDQGRVYGRPRFMFWANVSGSDALAVRGLAASIEAAVRKVDSEPVNVEKIPSLTTLLAAYDFEGSPSIESRSSARSPRRDSREPGSS